MLVLGVDPGSQVTGYGLLEKGSNGPRCLCCGEIIPTVRAPFYERIHQIFEDAKALMARFGPQEMAVEDVFYGKNVRSTLKLGHARGAVLIAAVQSGVRIFEYSPLEIKKSVVGYGRAPKEQVRSMVQVILKMESIPSFDASDALAAAICHLNWTDFRRSSPAGRVPG